jgi:cytochrome c oxidase subunit III
VSQSITLLFLGVLMGVLVWRLLRQTTRVQPWLADGVPAAQPEKAPPSATRVGLWVFLAVATSLFALFISAYTMRMELSDWKPLPEPGLLWLNTVVLTLTSATMQWPRAAAVQGVPHRVRSGLTIVGALTFAFLAGQWVVWQQLGASGFPAADNPANAFFYLLTALHALHLLGGLVVWARSTARVWRGVDIGEVRLSVELCTLYWHYLLLVWLVLFALLLST